MQRHQLACQSTTTQQPACLHPRLALQQPTMLVFCPLLLTPTATTTIVEQPTVPAFCPRLLSPPPPPTPWLRKTQHVTERHVAACVGCRCSRRVWPVHSHPHEPYLLASCQELADDCVQCSAPLHALRAAVPRNTAVSTQTSLQAAQAAQAAGTGAGHLYGSGTAACVSNSVTFAQHPFPLGQYVTRGSDMSTPAAVK